MTFVGFIIQIEVGNFKLFIEILFNSQHVLACVFLELNMSIDATRMAEVVQILQSNRKFKFQMRYSD